MTLCLNQNWQPNAATQLKLKQWGFSKGRIVDLLNRYKTSADLTHYTDARFVQFCTQNAQDIVSNVLGVTPHWKPSAAAVLFLRETGIPTPCVLEKYVPYFLSDFANKNITQASWDKAFIQFAISCWNRDPLNPNAKFARPIDDNWLPSESVIAKLNLIGVNTRSLTEKALEFRLYWRDAGGYKLDWDKAFFQWMVKP